MRLTLHWTAISILFATPGFSQLIVEHAAAVAGGGMGVAAGKPISDGISKVLGNVEQAPAKKAKPAPATKVKAPEPPAATKSATVSQPAAPTTPVASSGSTGSTPSFSPSSSASYTPAARPARKSRSAVAAPIETPTAVAVERPIEAIVEPDLTKASQGMKREDLLAIVGAPASRVTIPEEEHLLEIYRYSYGDRWLGTVRLDNGAVVKIDVAR